MKPLPYNVAFVTPKADIEKFKREFLDKEEKSKPHKVDKEILSELYRWYGLYLLEEGRFDDSIEAAEKAQHLLPESDNLVNASIAVQKMISLINAGDNKAALKEALNALHLLLEIKDKQSADFLAVLSVLLYNLAMVHNATGATGLAEKELAKSQKILEKLAKKDNDRFAASLLLAVEASTTVFKSRMKQMNTLAHYQVATATYLEKMNKGVESAAKSLVESLQKEGDILLQMGNFREAVKYYTKALRYQKKISRDLGKTELRISVNLGKALLHLINRYDTGRQLLQSMVPLAKSLGANAELEEINELLNIKPGLFEGLWKKLF